MSVCNTEDFDIDKIVFSEPVREELDKGGKKLTYYRMKMWYEKEEKSFYLQPHRLFTYGIQPSKSMEDESKITGYQCNYVLIEKPNEKLFDQTDDDGNLIQPSWQEMGANPEELKLLNILDALHKKTAKKLLEVKNKCNLGKIKNLDAMLDKLSPPYKFAKNPETKAPNYNKSPTLKTKILVSNKDMSIYSRFFDAQDEKLDVMTLIGNRCNMIPALAIESIYIGDAYVTFQIKLPEAVVYQSEGSGSKRLLKHITSVTHSINNNKDKKSHNMEDERKVKDENGTDNENNTEDTHAINRDNVKVSVPSDKTNIKKPVVKPMIKKSSSLIKTSDKVTGKKEIEDLLGSDDD